MPGKRPKPKLANCTPAHIRRLLTKLGGFRIWQGRKHERVEHLATGYTSTVPRGKPVNRHSGGPWEILI